MSEEKNVLADFMESFDEYMKNIRTQGEIEFPIEVLKINTQGGIPGRGDVGSWVSIRPVDDPKTYLGIYLGDLSLSAEHSYNVQTKEISIFPRTNPAIFVPDQKRILWGCESWWGFIHSPEDLRKISDADIQNIWYVRALKELTEELKP